MAKMGIYEYPKHHVAKKLKHHLSITRDHPVENRQKEDQIMLSLNSRNEISQIGRKDLSFCKKLCGIHHDYNPSPVWEKSVESTRTTRTGSPYKFSTQQHKNTFAKRKPASFKSNKFKTKKRASHKKGYVGDATQENEMALNSLSQIDRFSRLFFPLSFFLLNIMYWYIYLKRSERIALTFESF